MMMYLIQKMDTSTLSSESVAMEKLVVAAVCANAFVLLLLKGGHPSDLNNYYPISRLS